MKRGGGVSGAVSLVMIFCVLCLSVFAVLTLATAVREEKLTDMAAQSAADYWEADREAVEIVAALREGREVSVDVVRSGDTAEFSVPVGDSQQLEVAVALDSGNILRWQTVYTGEWQPDEFMDLWAGF